MNFKYVLLMILFIMNSAAAFVADLDYVQANSGETITCNKSELAECNQMDTGHCVDHGCCHQNHVHYYLLNALFLKINIDSTQDSFRPYLRHFSLNSLEITKPPIV